MSGLDEDYVKALNMAQFNNTQVINVKTRFFNSEFLLIFLNVKKNSIYGKNSRLEANFVI